jgi:hypothetical protein
MLHQVLARVRGHRSSAPSGAIGESAAIIG